MEPIKTTPNQLHAEVGNIAFTAERLIEMLADSDDKNEDFLLQHRHSRFIVPVEEIHKFFSTRPKPSRPMTKDQEIEYLRKKVKDYEAMMDANKLRQVPYVPADVASPPPPPFGAEINFEPGEFSESTSDAEAIPSDDDPLIPPLKPGKLETPDEIRSRLKSELEGKRPVKAKGRPAKVPGGTGKAAELGKKLAGIEE